MTTSIFERIRTADNLPTLPAVAIRVLEAIQDDDVSVGEIADLIQQDPALTGKVLKVVNSSMFGMPRRISSLSQAMVVLGLRTIKVMALSFSLVDTMNQRTGGGFDYTTYWRRSLTSAVAARLLADRVQHCVSDEAFVGGLLSDIGMLAAFHCAGAEYAEVLRAHQDRDATLEEVEQEKLGVSHAEISAFLLDHWGLPASLSQAVARHHQPLAEPVEDAETDRHLVLSLRAAAIIAGLFCADTAAERLDACKSDISGVIGIAPAELDALLEALDTHVRETASLFSLNIGRTRSYQEIQAEAVTHLARLSMTAELERAQLSQREQEARERARALDDQNRQLAQQASTDGLTGLSNRASFDQRLAAACEGVTQRSKSVGLLMLDIDRFKKLNDALGHQAGDEVLKGVAGVLAAIQSDRHFPARYGGEEFAVIVTGTSARQLHNLAESLRQQIEHLRVAFERRRVAVTVSVGAALMDRSDPALSPKELIARADRCLYDAKNAGRNRVVFTEPCRSKVLTAAVGGA